MTTTKNYHYHHHRHHSHHCPRQRQQKQLAAFGGDGSEPWIPQPRFHPPSTSVKCKKSIIVIVVITVTIVITIITVTIIITVYDNLAAALYADAAW